MIRNAIVSAPLSVLIVLLAAVALFEPEPSTWENQESARTADPVPSEILPSPEEDVVASGPEEPFEPPTAPEALDGLTDEEQDQGSGYPFRRSP